MGTYRQRIDKLKALKASLPDSVENQLEGQSSDVPVWEGGVSKDKFVEFVEESSGKVDGMLETISSFKNEVQRRITMVQQEFDSEVSKEKTRIYGINGKDEKETKKKRKAALSSISDESVKDRVKNEMNLY